MAGLVVPAVGASHAMSLDRGGPAQEPARTSSGAGVLTRHLNPRDDPLLPIALHIKQGGEIGVIDAGLRARGDLGLRPIGDAKPGSFEHSKIVGAVPDRERLLAREPERIG